MRHRRRIFLAPDIDRRRWEFGMQWWRQCRREHQIAEVVERDEQDPADGGFGYLHRREACAFSPDNGCCAP